MYVEGDKIIIIKELSTFKVFWAKYQLAIKGPAKGREVVLHFRVATSGKINFENCHPHVVNDKMAFCHNGIINYKMAPDSVVSDTMIFNDAILKGLPGGFLDNPATIILLEDYIAYSKMVFLSLPEQVTILNEKKGEWTKGIWFSNDGYKPIPQKIFRPTKVQSGISNWAGAVDHAEEVLIHSRCIECGKELDLKDDDQYEIGLCPSCLFTEGYYSQQDWDSHFLAK